MSLDQHKADYLKQTVAKPDGFWTLMQNWSNVAMRTSSDELCIMIPPS